MQAEPYIPVDGTEVIERLPARNDPMQREFNRLRAALAADPDNLPLASQLARRYIDAARADGDPRHLGYAQAALSPWWSQPQPPVEVRILRATLLQSSHRFAAALADLDAVLESDHRHPQAWLTKANIHLVQGNYAQAKVSCAKLYALVSELIAITCMANVASLNGQAAQSYALLSSVLQRNANTDPDIRLWALTLLAEVADRMGKAAAAEEHFRQALALSSADSYLLAAYADFLLDQNRPAEVVALLKDKTRNDSLLLRHAIALRKQGNPATAQIDTLRARFAAAQQRGDTVHQREQARFALQLLGRPQEALVLAQQNWASQKEPADARIFLEAAAAGQDRAAAQPVLEWLKRTGLQDHTLAVLAARFDGSK